MIEEPSSPTADAEPVLKLAMLSHGTLMCRNLERTREFYERFLGLDVVRTSKVSLWIRLNSVFAIACVQTTEDKKPMPLLNHNGLDVPTREDVDRCYATVLAEREKWGIGTVTKPVDQHGTYSFYFADLDQNWWEILVNPPGGYSWMFAQGRDVAQWGSGDDAFNPNAYAPRNRNSR